jgi:amino acid transporter
MAAIPYDEKKDDLYADAHVGAPQVEYGAEGDYDMTHAEEQGPGQLKRQLKSRHIAMISIGGVIGTGLFLGTAGSLKNGGPLGLLMGYAVVGSVCYAVMISLGEMVAFLPIPGGHIKLADRFIDPAFAFTLGWNYVSFIPFSVCYVYQMLTCWRIVVQLDYHSSCRAFGRSSTHKLLE